MFNFSPFALPTHIPSYPPLYQPASPAPLHPSQPTLFGPFHPPSCIGVARTLANPRPSAAFPMHPPIPPRLRFDHRPLLFSFSLLDRAIRVPVPPIPRLSSPFLPDAVSFVPTLSAACLSGFRVASLRSDDPRGCESNARRDPRQPVTNPRAIPRGDPSESMQMLG